MCSTACSPPLPSIVDLVWRVARPHGGILGHAPESPACTTLTTPGCSASYGVWSCTARLAVVLCQRRRLQAESLASLDHSDGPVEWLLLDRRGQRRNRQYGTGRPRGAAHRTRWPEHRVRHGPRQAGPARRPRAFRVLDRVGADRVFMMLSTAVQAYAVWYRDRHGMAAAGCGRRSPGTAAGSTLITSGARGAAQRM